MFSAAKIIKIHMCCQGCWKIAKTMTNIYGKCEPRHFQVFILRNVLKVMVTKYCVLHSDGNSGEFRGNPPRTRYEIRWVLENCTRNLIENKWNFTVKESSDLKDS